MLPIYGIRQNVRTKGCNQLSEKRMQKDQLSVTELANKRMKQHQLTERVNEGMKQHQLSEQRYAAASTESDNTRRTIRTSI